MSDAAMPVWKRRLGEYVMEDQEKKAKARRHREPNGGWTSEMRARVSPPFMRLVHQAAKMRGMTYGAYIRRCVAYRLSEDLGTPVEEILALTPYPSTYGAKSARPKSEPKPDDGSGFGSWQ